MSSSLVGLQRHHAGTRFCVAARGPLIVVVWGRVVEGEDLDHLAVVQREVVSAWGHCVVLTIIRAGLELTVKDEVREGSSRNMREFAHTNLGAALVVESGGFRAVFFRSVLTSIQLVSRSPVKQRVFDDIGAATRWLLEQPNIAAGVAREVDALLPVIHALADEFGQA